jgi:hypothetical protein
MCGSTTCLRHEALHASRISQPWCGNMPRNVSWLPYPWSASGGHGYQLGRCVHGSITCFKHDALHASRLELPQWIDNMPRICIRTCIPHLTIMSHSVVNYKQPWCDNMSRNVSWLPCLRSASECNSGRYVHGSIACFGDDALHASRIELPQWIDNMPRICIRTCIPHWTITSHSVMN